MWTEIILVESRASVMLPALRDKPDWTPNTMPLKVKQLSDLLPRIHTVLDYLKYEGSQMKSPLDWKEIEQNRYNRYLERKDHPYTLIWKCLSPETLYVFLPLYPGLDNMFKLGKFILIASICECSTQMLRCFGINFVLATAHVVCNTVSFRLCTRIIV